MSLSRLFDNAVARFPERIALDDGQHLISYRKLAERSNRLGQALLGLGLQPQRDHLVSLQFNATTLVEYEIAAARFGFARSMLNARAPAEDHGYCTNLVDAAVFVFQEQFTEHVDRLRAQLPSVRHYVCVGRAPSWAHSYEDLLARARGEAERLAAAAAAEAEAAAKRRERMAMDRIAAAEASAIADVRNAAAEVAAAAARSVLAETIDAKADAALVDGSLADLPKALRAA